MQADRQFSSKVRRRVSFASSCVLFLVVLVLGLAIRLGAIALYTHPEISNLGEVTDAVHESGLFGAYKAPASANHPPIEIASIGLATQIFRSSGGDTDTNAIASQIVAIKAASIFFDIATAIVAYVLIFRLAGPFWALLPATAILLNPVLIMVSSIWGQTDSVFTFFLVLSVAALYLRWNKGAWASWALSVLSKLQALMLIPLLVTATLVPRTVAAPEASPRREARWTWERLTVGIVISAIVIAVIMLPFYMGSGDSALQGLKQNAALPGGAHDAYNFWWWQSPSMSLAFSAGDAAADTQNVPGTVVSYWLAGWILLGGFVLLLILKMITSPQGRNEYLMAGLLQVGFFMFLTQMQERNLYPAIPLFALSSVGWDRRGRPRIDWRGVFFLLGFSLTLTYNLAATSALTPPQLLTFLIFLFPGGRDAVAEMNVLLLIAAVLVLFLPSRFKMPSPDQRSSLVMPARTHGQKP